MQLCGFARSSVTDYPDQDQAPFWLRAEYQITSRLADLVLRDVAEAVALKPFQRVLSEHEFDQAVAEAVAKLGDPAVFVVLECAGHRFGWPIPPRRRVEVALGLAIILQVVDGVVAGHA